MGQLLNNRLFGQLSGQMGQAGGGMPSGNFAGNTGLGGLAGLLGPLFQQISRQQGGNFTQVGPNANPKGFFGGLVNKVTNAVPGVMAQQQQATPFSDASAPSEPTAPGAPAPNFAPQQASPELAAAAQGLPAGSTFQQPEGVQDGTYLLGKKQKGLFGNVINSAINPWKNAKTQNPWNTGSF